MAYALSQDTYVQIRSFMRRIAGACQSCMRRNLGYCESCDAQTAKMLLAKMDAGVPPPIRQIDTSLRARIEVILSQLRKAKAPLRSCDIDTRDYCSKELKFWTLRKLISLGKVKSEKDGYFHVYSLAEGYNEKGKQK